MKNIIILLVCLFGISQLSAQDKREVDAAVFPNVVFVEPNPPKPIKGWEMIENRKPTDGKDVPENSKNVPMLVGEYPGSIIKFQFKGNAVGIKTVAISDAGIIEYSIDGSGWQKQDLFTLQSRQKYMSCFYTLESGLKDRRHTLQIRLTDDKNAESTGNKCIIHHFYFNAPR